MKFTLEIDCDNAAFEESPNAQLAYIFKIMHGAFKHMADGVDYGPVFDANGNKVGKWEID